RSSQFCPVCTRTCSQHASSAAMMRDRRRISGRVPSLARSFIGRVVAAWLALALPVRDRMFGAGGGQGVVERNVAPGTGETPREPEPFHCTALRTAVGLTMRWPAILPAARDYRDNCACVRVGDTNGLIPTRAVFWEVGCKARSW